MRILSDKKIIDALACPLCGADITVTGKSLVCGGARKHCFDIGGGGYVNFGAPAQSGGGDSKEAVRARSLFLNGGYYEPPALCLAHKISELVNINDGIIVDAGCGDGYYSSYIAENGYSVVGADISKFASDAAAKRMNSKNIENAFFSVASVFELPIRDNTASAVINVFAPCVEKEYARVLKPDGYLFVLSAGEEHLLGLKKVLYSQIHENGDRADMPVIMEKVSEENISFDICVNGNDNVKALFAMTPYYWRTSREDARKLENLEELKTKVDMKLTVYKNTLSAKERT